MKTPTVRRLGFVDTAMSDREALMFAIRRCGISVSERRRLVVEVQRRFGFSERHACRLVGQNRSSQRYIKVDDRFYAFLRERIMVLKGEFAHWGYRTVWAHLRHEGFRVTKSKVYKLYTEARTTELPKKATLNDRLGPNGPVRGTQQNQIWAADTTSSILEGGETLHWFAIIDEFTRYCVALHASENPFDDEKVSSMLKAAVARESPLVIRTDNSLFADRVAAGDRFRRVGVNLCVSPPASPWHNAIVEAFWARFKAERVNHVTLKSLNEALQLAIEWRSYYNDRRFHSAIGHLTPSAFAVAHREGNR